MPFAQCIIITSSIVIKIVANKMRSYLISLHRFYHHMYSGTYDGPVMPCIVAGVTLWSLLSAIDLIYNQGHCMNSIKDLHEFAVVLPPYVLILIFYFFYKNRLPSKEELNRKNGMWLGVILSVISIIMFLLVSILYND